jgi:hypothetical protein
MSVIIFFSASKNIFFGRNDVQAIDFLRKGSYAPVLYSSTVAHYPASQPANPSLLCGTRSLFDMAVSIAD